MTSADKQPPTGKDQSNSTKNWFEQIETRVKNKFIELSVHKELNEEIKLMHEEALKQKLSLQKKRDKKHILTGRDLPKSSQNLSEKRYPKVLGISQNPGSLEEKNHSSKRMFFTEQLWIAIQQRLAPARDSGVALAESNLRDKKERISACKRLIQKCKSSKNSNRRRTSPIVLQRVLTNLEKERDCQQIKLDQIRKNARDRGLKFVEKLMKKTKTGSSTTAQAIARMEERVLEREIKLTEALEATSGVITLSPTIFTPMEKEIESREELAKASLERIANLPAVETKTMTATEVKSAIIAFNRAKTVVEHCLTELIKTETKPQSYLFDRHEEKSTSKKNYLTKVLEEKAILAKFDEALQVAKITNDAQFKQSLEALGAIKAPIQQQLDEIDMVLAKLAERLAEIEPGAQSGVI